MVARPASYGWLRQVMMRLRRSYGTECPLGLFVLFSHFKVILFLAEDEAIFCRYRQNNSEFLDKSLDILLLSAKKLCNFEKKRLIFCR